MNYLETGDSERVLHLLEGLGFNLFAPELLTGRRGELRLLEGLEEFREHLGGHLALTLLQKIGSGFEIDRVYMCEITECVRELQARCRSRPNYSERVAA